MIYGFNIAQGDDLNLSEFATAGFAGVRRGFAGANSQAAAISHGIQPKYPTVSTR